MEWMKRKQEEIDAFMELHQYEGEPTPEEIIQRLDFWNSWDKCGVKGNRLRIWKACPNCGSDHTEWVRNQWYVCYDCIITFTLEDIEDYCDVQAYEADERIAEEDLIYLE
jgi:hypothetical protein